MRRTLHATATCSFADKAATAFALRLFDVQQPTAALVAVCQLCSCAIGNVLSMAVLVGHWLGDVLAQPRAT